MDGPVSVVAVHGLGGIGKSQLALEIAHRGRRAGRYELVWRVRAESTVTLVQDLVALAPALGVPDVPDQEQLAALVLGGLQRRSRWLMVLDNAPHADAVRSWIPTGGGHVLLTSRDRDWGGLAHPIPVAEFTAAEAVTFLGRHRNDPEPPRSTLAAVLGHLPLALAQAVSYLDRHDLSVAGYLDLYRDREAAGQLLASGLPGYPHSVATTWLMHLDQLQAQAPAALELLRLCAFCDPDDINVQLLLSKRPGLARKLTRELAEAAATPTGRESTIGALTATGLVTRLDDERIKLHRLVSQVTRHHLSTKDGQHTAKAWAVHTLNLLIALTPDEPWNPQSWPLCADLAQHLLAAADHAPMTSAAGTALTQLGQYLESRAEYHAAQTILLRASAIRQTVDGPDHHETARTLCSLGIVQREVGDLDAARTSHQQALAIYETVYGPDHPEVARTLNNLGNLQKELGDLDQARITLQRALAIKERTYGPDHLEIAPTLGNLGDIEQQAGELDNARASQIRAIAIFETAYGPNHSEVAIALTNLGIVQDKLDEPDASRASHLRALTIFEDVYGPDHPEVARALVNLGIVEQRLGKLDAARATLQRALTIFETRHGLSHPNTVYSARLLADITDEQRRQTAARPVVRTQPAGDSWTT